MNACPLTSALLVATSLMLSAGAADASAQISPAVGSAQISPAAVAGCYALQIGTWTPDHGRTYQLVPDTIRLDTIRGTRVIEGYGYVARPLLPRRLGLEQYAYWKPWTADSLTVQFTDGNVGSELILHAARDTMRGTIRIFTDGLRPDRPDPMSTVIAVRSNCTGSARESKLRTEPRL
jgi:hypothetical protein